MNWKAQKQKYCAVAYNIYNRAGFDNSVKFKLCPSNYLMLHRL